MALKVSTRARYALRMMVEISRGGRDEELLNLSDISRRTDISRRYLEQLVISLKNASLLTARSGRNGGYCLVRPASDISLGHIVEAAIGPVSIVECVLDPKHCRRSDGCEARLVWSLINCRIREVLYSYSLADLSNGRQIEKISAEIRGYLAAGLLSGDREPAAGKC